MHHFSPLSQQVFTAFEGRGCRPTPVVSLDRPATSCIFDNLLDLQVAPLHHNLELGVLLLLGACFVVGGV